LVGAVALTVALVATGCIRWHPPVLIATGYLPGAQARAVAFGDVTGDGLDDPLVLTNGYVVRLAPCGVGCVTIAQRLATDSALRFVVGDVDEDGIEDVIVAGPGQDATVLFGGTGTPSRPVGLSPDDARSFPMGSAEPSDLGDVDGDGHLDLVVLSSSSVAWHAGDGSGGFGPQQLLFSDASRVSLIEALAGDLDGDGEDEVVTSGYDRDRSGRCGSSYEVSVFGLGSATIDEALVLRDGPITHVQQLADVDGDGRADLLGRSCQASLAFVRSTGSSFTAFPRERFTRTVGALGAMVAGDLDADGRVDLVVSGRDDQSVRFWNGTAVGAGTPTPAAPFPLGVDLTLGASVRGSPQSLAMGDVDGDGLPELLAASTADRAGVVFVANDSVPTP
jgi:hypothetical protein